MPDNAIYCPFPTGLDGKHDLHQSIRCRFRPEGRRWALALCTTHSRSVVLLLLYYDTCTSTYSAAKMLRFQRLATLAFVAVSAVLTHSADNATGSIHLNFERGSISPIMGGQNFPDPSVIRMSDGWHAFATNGIVNGKLVHVQVAYSPNYKT